MEIAKQSAKGSIVLFIGNFGASTIAALGSFIVARLLGPSDYGLYALSIVTPTLLQLLTHVGTRTAVTRYVAQALAVGDVDRARRFSQSAVIFSVGVGALFAIVNYALSGVIASFLFQRPELQLYIAIGSVYLLGQCVILVVIATAIGWNAMGQASLANVLWALLRLLISPLLIVVGFGLIGAVWGQALAYIIGGTISAALLFRTRVKFTGERFGTFVEETREMIRYGFSPFLGNILGGLSTFYVTVLLATVAVNTVIGYYQAAYNLITPVTLLTAATASALYPAFSSLHATKGDTAQAFALSVKYHSYVVGPVLFFLAAAPAELTYLFYGNAYVPGSQYLSLLALAFTPVLLGQTILPAFFNGVGRPRLTFYATGVAAVLLFAAAPLLSVYFGLGVDGLILALFLGNITIAAVGLYLVKHYGLGSTGWESALATVAASVVGIAACLVIPSSGRLLVSLVVKAAVFVAIYLTLAPAFGAIDAVDLDRLSLVVSDIRGVKNLAPPIIRFEKAVIRWTRRGGKTSVVASG